MNDQDDTPTIPAPPPDHVLEGYATLAALAEMARQVLTPEPIPRPQATPDASVSVLPSAACYGVRGSLGPSGPEECPDPCATILPAF
jgi:hypothetical protein